MNKMQLIKTLMVLINMKKHVLGILIFVITFGIAFLVSPIRFSSFAFGSDEHGGFTAYESTDFVKLTSTTERYETSKEAMEAFENHIKQYSKHIENQETVRLEENRAIITFQTEYFGQGFCLIKKEDYKLYDMCSTSLSHILEFEKQKFLEN